MNCIRLCLRFGDVYDVCNFHVCSMVLSKWCGASYLFYHALCSCYFYVFIVSCTCVVASGVLVVCSCVFACLSLTVNCLMNVFAICLGVIFSLKVVVLVLFC